MRTLLLMFSLVLCLAPVAEAQIFAALPYPGTYRLAASTTDELPAPTILFQTVVAPTPLIAGVQHNLEAGGEQAELWLPFQPLPGFWLMPAAAATSDGRWVNRLHVTAIADRFQTNAVYHEAAEAVDLNVGARLLPMTWLLLGGRYDGEEFTPAADWRVRYRTHWVQGKVTSERASFSLMLHWK